MIPRVAHRIWIGGEEPDWLRRFADTWARPGWAVRQWTDTNVASLFPLRNQYLYDAAEELMPDHVGQFRADLLRYEILHRLGGVYVDADLECLHPIDELIAGARCFAAWESQDRWIANGFMGAECAHPFLDELIEAVPGSIHQRRGERPARVTGPQFLTRMQRRHGGLDLVLPEELIYPYGHHEAAEHAPGEDFPGYYTAHHWHNQRRERGLPCPA